MQAGRAAAGQDRLPQALNNGSKNLRARLISCRRRAATAAAASREGCYAYRSPFCGRSSAAGGHSRALRGIRAAGSGSSEAGAGHEAEPMGTPASPQPGDSSGGSSGSSSRHHHQPWWVRRMNGALELNAAATLLAFVVLDMGSGLFLWGLYAAVGLGVDADFALAYAAGKALRAPRLALDASAAAALARLYPPLAQVRVCLIVDAAVGFAAATRAALGRLLAPCWPFQRPRRDEPSTPEAKGAKLPRSTRATAAAREARRLADTYGLALMAAKNFIGPVSIAGIYLALRAGLDVQGWLASLEVYGVHLGGAGKAAGLMAAASWTSTLLFPAVVMGAAELGPVIHRAAQRGLGGLGNRASPLPPSTDAGARA